ncbi:MAG: diacylglycerol kinase family protein [Clostridiales bacterium]|jgi:diacylglycerol kinase (ATP)|nr:diacylglycerol kinase family protein [Clostridiales bacterium]
MTTVPRKILKSFKYSYEGIVFCLKSERNFRIHVFAGLLVLYLSPLYHFTALEGSVLTIVIFIVLIMEIFNTALENLVDLVTTDYHSLARIVKDLSAGAVSLSAICALVVGYFMLIDGVNLTATFAPLLGTRKLISLILFLTASAVLIYLPVRKDLK